MDKLPLSDKFLKDDKFLNTLAEAYRLQEAIMGATELAVISTNKGGIITSFNKAAELLLGYTSDEVVGKETPVLFHDQSELLRRAGKDSAPGNSLFDFLTVKARKKISDRNEWTYISKNGKRIPVLLSITALRDENDGVFGFAGIATDISEQKAAEQKIKESEAHLNAILTSMDDTTFEIDEAGRYVNVWTNHDELVGIPVSSMRNKTFNELFGEEFARPFNELRKRILATGVPEEVEFKSPRDGEERWFNVKYSRIHDNQGNPTSHISAALSEITERKKAEQALKASEEKFRLLAQNIPGAIYLYNNSDRSVIYLNDKAEEITGYPASDFLSGKINLINLQHPEDTAAVTSGAEKALTEKTSFQLKYRILHRSGEVRWIKNAGVGLYDGDKLLMVEGVITDITSQKNAEDEFQKIARQNHSIFNASVSLNALSGFDGYFKRVNPMWTELTGWSSEELTSKPFMDFVHPEDKQSTLQATTHLTGGNNLPTFENRYICKDGTYRWLLWSCASDAQNELIYATAIDITERKKSEEELLLSKKGLETLAVNLQEQNRQLDEFAHIISHNLRSPVGNIKALINLLNSKSSLDDYRLIFDKLKNVSNNLGETMNDLMDTLKVKKEDQVERTEIRFREILDKVIQSLEGELIRSGASVTFNFDKAPVIAYSKPYLESIILNLLSNAIKYRSPDRKPAVHFESIVNKTSVELHVSDNGLGIDLERFGDKLFGLHKTFHGNKEARGVGLFLIKTQVEALGGSISAESEVGKGSTFKIKLC